MLVLLEVPGQFCMNPVASQTTTVLTLQYL